MNLRALGAYGKIVSLVARRTLWVTAALTAAGAFFGLGLLFRVLIGPVSLGPFSDELRSALNQVLPGLDVRFDEAALEWDRSEGRINLVILGTRVLDRGQHIIAQAPKAEIGLAAAPFLRGRIAIKRIALVGVQLTLVHTSSGALRLGLQSGNSDNDILQRIRDAISHNKSDGSALQSFAVRNARLAFYDEASGAFIVAPRADLQVSTPRKTPNSNVGLTASLAAQIELSGKPVRVFADINFPVHGDLSNGDLSISGLSLPALAHDGRKFGFLAPLQLTADITSSWTLAHGTELRSADFGIGASGYVTGLGHPLHVKSLRLVGRYDAPTGRLLIDDATLTGEEARAHLTGSVATKVDQAGNFTSAFKLAMDQLGIDVPGAMERPVKLGHASLAGTYDSAAASLVLDRAAISGGPLSAALAGRITLAKNQSPQLDLDGKVDSIAVRDLLAYWPLRVAPGARAWIAANVTTGYLGPALIHTRIPAGAFEGATVPDKAVLVSFPMRGATINYLHGLTPLTNVSGIGYLSGDNFRADVSSAAVGPLTLSRGQVIIANLHVPASPAIINAHIAGGLPQLFSLLDMKPLQYPTRFHINIASVQGSGAFDASFRVPTIRSVSFDAVSITVNGTGNNFAIALGPHTKFSNGTMRVAVDNAKLHAVGRINYGATPLDVDWLETFKPVGNVSTTLDVRGVLDDAARAALNIASESFLTGPVGARAHLLGLRGKLRSADIDLDLTQAVLSADLLAWRKPAGSPATAHVAAQLDESGSFHNAALNIQGPTLAASANIAFAADGSIDNVSAPFVRAGADNNFAIIYRKQTNGGKDIAITGQSLDASGLLKHKPGAGAAKSTNPQSTEPIHLTANLDRLVFRNGVAFAPFSVDFNGIGKHPIALTAKAGLGTGASLSLRLVTSGGQRHITATAGDAGALIGMLLDTTSVKGGELSLDAVMPLVGADTQRNTNAPDYAGELIIRKCTILNQPFFARLFSAGSPGGMVDLMRGQGITLDTVHIPFRVGGDVVTIHDARATGPALGLTADGYIDRASNQVALSGAVAPVYGLNGLLGAIPVLGDVFVSKKGEGLFGMTYSVHGDLDHPQVSTNPLSVLAPGILRRIFEGGTPAAPAQQANPPLLKPQ